MVHYLRNEVVKVDGLGKFTLQGWLTNTRHAIRILRQSIGQPATQAAQWAIQWLRACGVTTREQVEALDERLQLLALGPDPSRIVRCTRCARPLADPLSKTLAMGPQCRKQLFQYNQRRRAYHAAIEQAFDADEHRQTVEA